MEETIAIKQMTTQHIQNRIAYLRRFIDKRPPEAYYMGESDYGDDYVEQENRHNEFLAEKVNKEIYKLLTELKERLK